MQDIINFIQNNPEQVAALTALCAIIISFFSIVIIALSFWTQRRHNFKSLTPIAQFPISDYDNLIAVKLKNTGVGPLLVEKFTSHKGNIQKDNIISWMPKTPKGLKWDTFYDSLDGLSIPPNQEEILIELSGNIKDEIFIKFRDKSRKALKDLKIKVQYRDIYNRKMPLKERDLKWFGRHFIN